MPHIYSALSWAGVRAVNVRVPYNDREIPAGDSFPKDCRA
jgi:hypothetical protein